MNMGMSYHNMKAHLLIIETLGAAINEEGSFTEGAGLNIIRWRLLHGLALLVSKNENIMKSHRVVNIILAEVGFWV